MTDLEWRPAMRRAGFFVALWLITIYALSVAYPETFYLGLDTSGGVLALLLNALMFFFLFSFITALSERRRKRARRGAGTQSKAKPPRAAASGTEEGEETGPSDLKGRHNPNTSRKKASRRRRR